MINFELKSFMFLIVRKLSGWLLLLSLLVSVINAFFTTLSVTLAGIMTLIAIVLLFSRLLFLQKLQVLLLSLTGIALTVFSDRVSYEVITQAITMNHAVIAIVVSISFLRLIVTPGAFKETLPEGVHALWKTLCGVFAFTAVINLSAVAIFGDRLSRSEKLSQSQVMILTRMFGANALWSPFFVSMGAALINSGGAELKTLLMAGIILALCSLLVTGIHGYTMIKLGKSGFKGYPMHKKSLFLPALLSSLVMITGFFFEKISILILVSLVVVGTVFITMLFSNDKPVFVDLRKHIDETVPGSVSEVALFFSAGILATGISCYLLSVDYQLPIQTFNGYWAATTLVIMIILSLLGLHPIVCISVIGGLLVPLSPDPNLLGIMFIFSWGLSVPLSPFSAINLMMQSRYRIGALDLFKTNIGFTLFMLIPASTVLILYGNRALT